MAWYNKNNLGKLNTTGFLQIMSVATDVIIQEYGVSNDTYRYSMMYMPMNTGIYYDNTLTSAQINIYFPWMVLIWANIGANIIIMTKEDHEEKI